MISIASDRYVEIVDPDEFTSGWVGERESRTVTANSEFDELEIKVEEMYAMPQLTQKLIDDSGINIEQWASGKIAESFSYRENTSFFTGTGVKQPRGLLTYTSGSAWNNIEQVNMGAASTLTANGLMLLPSALKTAYAANAKWFMERATHWLVRALRADAVSAGDGAGPYLWQPTLEPGLTGTLLGYPIVQAEDMPTVTTNALAIMFGDLGRAYYIIDRLGIRTIRDEVTSKPNVLLYTTKRVGGGLRLGEAVKIGKVEA